MIQRKSRMKKQKILIKNAKCCSPNRIKKVSTNDAKALKLEILDTNVPPLQMKDWYWKRDNYQPASSWGHSDNQRTYILKIFVFISNKTKRIQLKPFL